MKRLIAFILILCLSALLFTAYTSAEGEVYVAAGNTVLPLTNALPIRSSGVWYIDYQCFTKGNLNVNTSYNATDATLVLYTWDTTLIFDLNATVAYTAADKIQYKAVAFVSNGTVYVPVQFTAQMLGFDYTYFSDLPMIRIKRSSDIQDNMFMYIAESEIAALKNNEQLSPDTPSDANPVYPEPSPSQPSSTTDSNTTDRKNIKLTFNITDGKNMSKILDSLSRYGYRATFFIRGSAIENCENEIRRAVISGHTIGTLSQNGSDDFSQSNEVLKAMLSEANDNLFEISKTKTRLLRIPGRSSSLANGQADALISWGYRIWDSNISPTGNSATAVYNSTVSKLKSLGRNVVIELSDSTTHVNALTRILRYFNTNEYYVSSLDVLDTPVNDIADKR